MATPYIRSTPAETMLVARIDLHFIRHRRFKHVITHPACLIENSFRLFTKGAESYNGKRVFRARVRL
jgi:hypothetical protein